MSDTINRQDAINAMSEWLCDETDMRDPGEVLGDMPSAQRKGKWEYAFEDERKQIGWYECSECKYPISWKANFCPNCGARMGEQDETE